MYLETIDWSHIVLIAACVILTGIIVVMFVKLEKAEKTIQRLEGQRLTLQSAVVEAREAFVRYAQIHNAKKTEEGEAKAAANQRLADTMLRSLRATGWRPLEPMQRVFENMHRRLASVYGTKPGDRPGTTI